MGSLFGGDDAAAANARARAEASKLQEKQFQQYEDALKYYEGIGVPPIEAQKIALEAAELGPEALEAISGDPSLRNKQMDALGQLEQFGEAGLTEAEKAQAMQMQHSAAAAGQAQDKAILQNMAERGIGGGGAELAARLNSSQAGAESRRMAQAELAGQAQNRAMQAITQKAGLAGQMSSQDLAKAEAANRIRQFNEMNRSATANQEQIHNKALIQQQFGNQMGLAGAKANVKAGLGAQYGQAAGQAVQSGQAEAQGHLGAGAAKAQLIGGLAGAGASAYAAADGGVIGTPEYSQRQYADGGAIAPAGVVGYEEGGMIPPEGTVYEGGDIVDGESYAGDRVDAQVNSGEMVINLEQQQRLMDILKGLRGVEDIGSEDIVQGADGSDISAQVAQSPETMNPELTAAPDQFSAANGGIAPAEFKTPTEAKPRGLHASHKHEQEQLAKKDEEQKHRKARLKAMETLMNGGR